MNRPWPNVLLKAAGFRSQENNWISCVAFGFFSPQLQSKQLFGLSKSSASSLEQSIGRPKPGSRPTTPNLVSCVQSKRVGAQRPFCLSNNHRQGLIARGAAIGLVLGRSALSLSSQFYQSVCHFSVQSSSSSGDSQEEQNQETMSYYVVGHDKQQHFFYIQLRGNNKSSSDQNDLAILEYQWVHPNLVDLYHTEVPPEFQGQGIAKHLAKAAFDHFCEQEVKFRPTCTYLQKYLKENPLPRYTNNVDTSSS